MFTSFREKQEQYTPPPPPERSSNGTTFREKQEQYTPPPPPERPNSGTGHIIFLEDGDILPPHQVVIPSSLKLIWTNLFFAYVYLGISDPTDVNQWNSAFNLPTRGTPFISVIVDGNIIYLYGGENINIVDGIFKGIEGLKEIIDNAGSIVYIGGGNLDFSGCPDLTTVSLPAVTSIETFDNCYILTSVSIPVCTSIGYNCFDSCNNLTSIDAPLVQVVGNYAFTHCISLTSISLPSCTTVGYAAFSQCSSLYLVNIPVCTNLSTPGVFDGVNQSYLIFQLTCPLTLITDNNYSIYILRILNETNIQLTPIPYNICDTAIPLVIDNQSISTSGTTTYTTNIYGPSSTVTLTLDIVASLSAPSTITGLTEACQYINTNTPITYTASPVAGATSYSWYLPSGIKAVSTGTSGIVITTTNTIDVTFDSNFYTYGIIYAAAVNSAGCTSTYTQLTIYKTTPVLNNPTGPANASEYIVLGTQATYTVTPSVNGTAISSYTWTVPTGVTIVSGQGTNTINVTFSNSFTNSNISVVANSNCGTSTSKSISISIGSLQLTWDNISNVPVANASSVSNWNTYFSLPTSGSVFTSASVSSNTVSLYGGGNITLKDSLFYINTHLTSINDTAYCVTSSNGTYTFGNCTSLSSVNLPNLRLVVNAAFNNCNALSSLLLPNVRIISTDPFSSCTSLTSLSFPNVTSIGDYCFAYLTNLTSLSLPSLVTTGIQCFRFNGISSLSLPSLTTMGAGALIDCQNLTSLSIPSCTNLGGSVNNDAVFTGVTGKNPFNLTVKASLMTCNSGNPDGDIQYLQANNNVVVTQV